MICSAATNQAVLRGDGYPGGRTRPDLALPRCNRYTATTPAQRRGCSFWLLECGFGVSGRRGNHYTGLIPGAAPAASAARSAWRCNGYTATAASHPACALRLLESATWLGLHRGDGYTGHLPGARRPPVKRLRGNRYTAPIDGHAWASSDALPGGGCAGRALALRPLLRDLSTRGDDYTDTGLGHAPRQRLPGWAESTRGDGYTALARIRLPGDTSPSSAPAFLDPRGPEAFRQRCHGYTADGRVPSLIDRGVTVTPPPQASATNSPKEDSQVSSQFVRSMPPRALAGRAANPMRTPS